MPGIDRDLIQFRHNAVYAERLIPQLPGLDHFAGCLRRRTGGANKGQVFCAHIAVTAIRTGNLIPCAGGFIQHNHLSSFLVLAEDFVLCASARAQAQRVALGSDLINIVACGLRYKAHLRRHTCRHRRTENITFRQPLPFAQFVDGMNQRQFPFAVERFGNDAGLRIHRAKPVVGKVRAIRGINANQTSLPPLSEITPIWRYSQIRYVTCP